MVDDVGRFLAGDEAPPDAVAQAGREALARASEELSELLRTTYAPHEVVATELRFAGPARGFRRTVVPLGPTPVALMLLCLGACDPGDDVIVLQHTAACGSLSRTGTWPFGLAVAEELTRPPAGDANAPVGLEDLGYRPRG
ncbi:MAG TPA: hypothetical protein VH479_10065 [Acidimicrobiales bacterium]|jgi:hypothetical protein